MSLRVLQTLILGACVSSIVVGAKLDPNIGSNWYVPTPSSNPQGLTSEVGNEQLPNKVQNVLSSFIPTTNALGSLNSDPVANYNALHQPRPTFAGGASALGQGQQYQYFQYNPEANSYNVYPAGVPGTAEQRQEFFNPNINGFPPLDGDGPLDPNTDGGEGSIFDNLPSVGGIASGITGTASSIAQGIGLGSLGIFGSILVLLIGAPLIIFAILFPAAILVIAILGFPVLQLTLPATDPFLGRKLKTGVMDAAMKAKLVLQSEECVERFSCELARKSRKLPYENWIIEKMDKMTNTWANRVSKSVKYGRAGEDCQRFQCAPMTRVKTIYENFKTSTAKYLKHS